MSRPYREEDGEQEDKAIWYYSTKVSVTHADSCYCVYCLEMTQLSLFVCDDDDDDDSSPLPSLCPSQVQLAELIDCLDKEFWEADLYGALEEIRDEVHTHMDITEDLTNKARGNNRCFLTAANGNHVIFFFVNQSSSYSTKKQKKCNQIDKI